MNVYEDLEAALGYVFKHKSLLKQALTHSSVTGNTDENYERLEFLGDRVLGLAVAEMLYKEFKKESEGSLSQRHTALVCKETVAEVSRNDNVLCDVGEAIIGAIFLESGADEAFAYVRHHWEKQLHKAVIPPKDCKTALQEMAHTKGLEMPVYEVIKREGSEHEPIFHIAVRLGADREEIGTGKNKKLAEQDAAHKMLEKIRSLPDHGK